MSTTRANPGASKTDAWHATGSFERFRHTRVHVVSDAQSSGKHVELREAGRVLAAGEMTTAQADGRATLDVRFDAPPVGSAFGEIDVVVNDQKVCVVELPDIRQLRAQAMHEQQVVADPFIFTGERLPDCDFSDPARVENLIGDYVKRVRYFDAELRPVGKASTPGRYLAFVEVTTPSGVSIQRVVTLFRAPDGLNWQNQRFDVRPPGPSGLGIRPETYAVFDHGFRAAMADFYEDRFEDYDEAAQLCAFCYDRQANPEITQVPDIWWWDAMEYVGGLRRKLHAIPRRTLDFLPRDYDADPGRRWPLVIFLHGSGEAGEGGMGPPNSADGKPSTRPAGQQQQADELYRVQSTGLPRHVLDERRAGRDVPFILVAPQCPMGEWWSRAQIETTIDDAVRRYRVDPDRIYLTGLSLGGYGTWAMAMATPDRFAAIVPMCGSGDLSAIGRLKHVPVWAFHGERDWSVPFVESVRLVEGLRKIGADAKFTAYPDLGHDVWTRAYADPELYTWMLAQRRKR